MTTSGVNFSFYAGDTFSPTFYYSDNISGYDGYMSAKYRYCNSGSFLSGNINIISETGGVFNVTFDTTTGIKPGIFPYQVKLTNIDNNEFTSHEGLLYIYQTL